MSLTKYRASHRFLFHPGTWKGSGSIIILQTGALIHFTLTWEVEKLKERGVVVKQRTCLIEIDECWTSLLRFANIDDDHFDAELHHPAYGNFHGTGTISEKEISWLLLDNEHAVIGKTNLTRQEEGHYLLHSAYQFKGSAQLGIAGIISSTTTPQKG